jgi:nucleotide-binding universal stress UspA family protein
MKKPAITNILVPVDFSDLSIQAIERAKALARRLAARIHLIHVQEESYPAGFAIRSPMIAGDVVSILEENEKHLLKRLREVAARLDLSPENCEVVADSPAFDVICKSARTLSIDLIVMPTHGNTGLKHVFLGSTAERVVQHSPCPVFIVRAGGERVHDILVPVDFSDFSLKALLYAIEFAKAVAAKIIVFHSVYLGYAFTSDGYAMYDLTEITKTMRKNAECDMAKFVRAAKFDRVQFETVVRVGEAAEEICEFAKEQDVDLIITTTRGRTGFAHVLMGSVAEKVVRHADRPVLILPTRYVVRRAAQSKQRRAIVCGVHRPKPAKPVVLPGSRRELRFQRHAFPERRKTNKFRESHAQV